MIYKGTKLKEITEQQIFNPPKKMLVWNNTMDYAVSSMIVAIVERMDGLCAMCYDGEAYPHCAEIPEPRRATNRELAWWLSQGYGQKSGNKGIACISYSYGHLADDCEIDKNVVVRKWGDTDWHEPTVDYLGIKE